MPDSQWHPLQWLQSPPHDDLPLFLSLTIPFMISPTIKTKIAPTINVPINDTSCLYHYHTHIITILQSDNQQSTNCLSEPAPPDGTQALILLLFYLAFAIPFTFTLRLLLSL